VGQTLEAQRVWLSSEEKNLLLQMLVILDVCYQGKARYFHIISFSFVISNFSEYWPRYDRHGAAGNEGCSYMMLKSAISY
jgi:hypothetical protein